MIATLDFAGRLGVAVLVLLAAGLLTRGSIRLYLRIRGPVWHVGRPARQRRLAEAGWAGLAVALPLGVLAARLLPGLPWWAALGVGLPVTLGVAWLQIRALRDRITLGEALLGDDGKGADPQGHPTETPMPDLPPRAPPATGRRIVILCDGTGNRPPDARDPAATNIWKIHQALVQDETQVVCYDPGVGTGSSRAARLMATAERWAKAAGIPLVSTAAGWGGRIRAAWEAMTGTGLGENILEGYREIARQYRPGDRIYLLGFSRGAYTARCIAGVIARCGVLKASNDRYVPAVLDLYRSRRGANTAVPVRDAYRHLLPDAGAPGDPAKRHPHVPIEMLGVFDTVAALGAPLWGWWFTVGCFRNRPLSTNPVPNCRHVHHALAMDERRASFFPTLFWRPRGARRGWNETLEQVWFRGAHADIGGGYPETGISDITLGWMLERLARHGLAMREEALEALRPDPLARLHDETARQPSWQMVGTWPRWARLDDGAPSDHSGIAVHASVFERAAAIRTLGRPDLLDLAPGERIAFMTEAHRQWDRTGLVIRGRDDPDAWYRLTYRGGAWRDKDLPPCGPAGDGDGEHAGDVRRRWRSRRRVPQVPWMTLCATLAGPRRWKLRELPLGLAWRYLFRRDPRLLLDQVAPLGTDLGAEGASVLIRSGRPTSMLYLFANDLWQTVGNNSGALELTLERLPGDPGGREPLWHLPGAGPWQCHAGGDRPPPGEGSVPAGD